MFSKIHKIVLLFLLLPVLTTVSTAQDSNRIRVAVLSFDTAGLDASAGIVLTDRFRAELLNTGRFDVMERSRMDEILQEQGFQQTGACNSEACIVQVGKILGVSRMIAGSVGRVGNLYTTSARIVNIETGRILISKTEDCDCSAEQVLTQSMRNLAYKLAGLTPGQTATAMASAVLSITGKPSGAVCTLNNKKIGIVPLNNITLIPGAYTLIVKSPGYENAKYSIKLSPFEKKTLNVILATKSSSNATYWSLVIPGLGQILQGRKLGWLYMIGFAGGGAYYSQQLNAHNDNIDDYDRLVKIYKSNHTAINQEAAKSAYDKAENSYKRSNIIAYGIVGIYAVNLLDALLFTHPKPGAVTGIQTRIRPLYTNLSHDNPSFGVRLEIRR